MSLKERLFGPAWESKDPAARRRAVLDENDPRLRQRLPEIASGDSDPEVRLAALQRLGDETAWLDASDADPEPRVREAADQALVRRVTSEPAKVDASARADWLKRVSDPDVLRRIARGAKDTALRDSALARIASPGFLGDCVISEPDPALAERTLQRIEQASTLRRIADALRKGNKKRHRLVMQRLAELEHGRADHAATDELAMRLIERVEQIVRGGFSGDRATALDGIEREWRGLDLDDPALQRRFSGALRIARAALQPRQPRPHETAETVAKVDKQSGDDALTELVERARGLAASPDSDETAAALDRMISKFDRRWNEIRKPGEADRRLRDHFDALTGELQARLQAWRSARADRAAPQAASPSARSDSGEELDELSEALDQADQALESGDIRVAHEAVQSARKRLDALPRKRQPGAARSRLGRMSARLKEMRDWQHWSNNKLRERLIERAGEIDAAQLHPDAVTARLKELRERWKELDELELLPGEKRRFAAPQGQWRRFQRACKDAFEAAKPYLEKRSEVRNESLQELRDFIRDAEAIAAGEASSLDQLIRYQRAARQAIRNLDSLPPPSRSQSASSLRKLMDSLSVALDRRFEAVEANKRRLVAEARKLAHATDRGDAIDRAKALQAEWKKAGRGRKKVEDRLWREFREPIDPLFEGLKQARDRQRQADHEYSQALEGLCSKAEQLARSDDPEAARGPLAGLEEEFAAFERVPGPLAQRFERALAAHRDRISEAQAERAERRIRDLRRLADRLQQAWQQIIDKGSADIDAPESEAYADDRSARNLAKRLASLAAAGAAVDGLQSEVKQATREARQVVIEMECLSGLETPEADRQQRMDFQVDRLSTRLGEGAPRPDLASERAELHKRWWESFPHDPDQHAELDKRFAAADRILTGMMDS
jgi:flagellin-specific chaperone FliS